MRIRRTRRGSERGSILLHVMVTAVLVAIISAGIMRMAMLRSKMAARNHYVLQEKREDTSAMAQVVAQWSTVVGPNSVCSGAPPGYTVNNAGTPGTCACKYTQNSSGVDVIASVVGGNCQLAIGGGNDVMPSGVNAP